MFKSRFPGQFNNGVNPMQLHYNPIDHVGSIASLEKHLYVLQLQLQCYFQNIPKLQRKSQYQHQRLSMHIQS
ncbi:unnamed protein product [Paramecium octaurelia]|uniref:Uncharacterized protein n=1 Tax=Paramecium octaurelia TaxID=43137 RepID=A0A8S1YFQ4_PAROT|nr:unnamed protein product [Paramecium octaurelia]